MLGFFFPRVYLSPQSCANPAFFQKSYVERQQRKQLFTRALDCVTVVLSQTSSGTKVSKPNAVKDFSTCAPATTLTTTKRTGQWVGKPLRKAHKLLTHWKFETEEPCNLCPWDLILLSSGYDTPLLLW